MTMIGIGLGLDITGGPSGPAVPTIQLSNVSVAENAANGAIGTLTVSNGTGTYTFSEIADPDSKFTVTGTSLNKAAAMDYETATSHSVTVQATNGVDTPLTRVFSISVTNVLEGGTLAALTLDVASYEEDAARTSTFSNRVSGSTLAISAGALPTGMTLDSGAGTIAGTPTTPGTYNFTVDETKADTVNGPTLSTALSITVTAAVGGGTALGDIQATDNVLVLAIGQSNAQTANTDAAMATTKFGSPWNATHRQWVVAANAWQSYVPGTNSAPEGSAIGGNWSWEAGIASARATLGHTGKTDIIKEAVAGNGLDPKYSNGNWYPGGVHPEGFATSGEGTRVLGLRAQIAAAIAANTAAGGVAYNRIKITWKQGEADLDALGSAVNYRVLVGRLVVLLRGIAAFTGIPMDFLFVRPRPTNGTTEVERHIRGTTLRNGAYLAMTVDLAGITNLTVGMIDIDPCGVGFPSNDAVLHPASGNPQWMYDAIDRVKAYYAGVSTPTIGYDALYGSIGDVDPGAISNLGDSAEAVGNYATSANLDMGSLIQQVTTIPTLPAGVEARITAFDGTVITNWTNTPLWIDKFHRVQFRHQIASTGTNTNFTLQIGSRTFTWRAAYGVPTLVPVYFDTVFSNTLVAYSTVTTANDKATRTTSGALGVRAASAITGKSYIKVTVNDATPAFIGYFTALTAGGGGNTAGNRAGLINIGTVRHPASAGVETTGATVGNPSTTSILEFAIDRTANLLWVRRNGGTWNADALANPDTAVGGVSIAGMTGTLYFGGVLNSAIPSGLTIATGASPLTTFPRLAV